MLHAVDRNHRVEDAEHPFVAELADNRDHDQVVHRELRVLHSLHLYGMRERERLRTLRSHLLQKLLLDSLRFLWGVIILRIEYPYQEARFGHGRSG